MPQRGSLYLRKRRIEGGRKQGREGRRETKRERGRDGRREENAIVLIQKHRFNLLNTID
jgi:hypothetical protein